jgi:hypothetical protein
MPRTAKARLTRIGDRSPSASIARIRLVRREKTYFFMSSMAEGLFFLHLAVYTRAIGLLGSRHRVQDD